MSADKEETDSESDPEQFERTEGDPMEGEGLPGHESDADPSNDPITYSLSSSTGIQEKDEVKYEVNISSEQPQHVGIERAETVNVIQGLSQEQLGQILEAIQRHGENYLTLVETLFSLVNSVPTALFGPEQNDAVIAIRQFSLTNEQFWPELRRKFESLSSFSQYDISTDVSSQEICFRFANLAYVLKHLAVARKHFEQLKEVDILEGAEFSRTILLYNLGITYTALGSTGDLLKAKDVLHEAEELDPEMAEVKLALSVVYRKLGKHKESREYLARVEEINPALLPVEKYKSKLHGALQEFQSFEKGKSGFFLENRQLRKLTSLPDANHQFANPDYREFEGNYTLNQLIDDLKDNTKTITAVIRGDMGMGKTVAMRYMALKILDSDVIPVVVPLIALKEKVSNFTSLDKVGSEYCRTGEIPTGRRCYFFDGFDEIPEDIQNSILEFINRNRNRTSFVISGRPHALRITTFQRYRLIHSQGPLDIGWYELAGLTRTEIDRAAREFATVSVPVDGINKNISGYEILVKSVQSAELLENPFYLMVILTLRRRFFAEGGGQWQTLSEAKIIEEAAKLVLSRYFLKKIKHMSDDDISRAPSLLVSYWQEEVGILEAVFNFLEFVAAMIAFKILPRTLVDYVEDGIPNVGNSAPTPNQISELNAIISKNVPEDLLDKYREHVSTIVRERDFWFVVREDRTVRWEPSKFHELFLIRFLRSTRRRYAWLPLVMGNNRIPLFNNALSLLALIHGDTVSELLGTSGEDPNETIMDDSGSARGTVADFFRKTYKNVSSEFINYFFTFPNIWKKVLAGGNRVIKIDLSSLSFGKNRIEFPNGLLRGLSDLEVLELHHNNIQQLPDLSELTSLRFLFLSFCRLKTIELPEALANLEELDLYNNRLTAISGLEHLVSLRKLWVGDNKLRKLSGLKNLRYLQLLDARNNHQLTSVSGLKFCKRLHFIDLRSALIGSIDLSGLVELRKLVIKHCRLREITGLRDLRSLNVLDIRSNEILRLNGLEKLTQLKSLHAGENEILEIPSLSSECRLQELDLKNNNIVEIHSIRELKHLRVLNLQNNRIYEMPRLSMPNLQVLDMRGNALSSFPDISSLPALKRLILDYNTISPVPDISHKRLEILSLTHCSVRETRRFNLPKLKVLDLNNNELSEFPDVSSLHSLHKLLLRNNNISHMPDIDLNEVDVDLTGNPL